VDKEAGSVVVILCLGVSIYQKSERWPSSGYFVVVSQVKSNPPLSKKKKSPKRALTVAGRPIIDKLSSLKSPSYPREIIPKCPSLAQSV